MTSDNEPKGGGALPSQVTQDMLGSIGKFIAAPAILAALLFYFGWAQTHALYKSLGIDQSLLCFSATDYLLRSISAAFWPVHWVLLGGLAAVILDYFLRHRLGKMPSESRCKSVVRTVLRVICALAVGFVLVIVVILPNTLYNSPLLYAALWTAGVAIAGYTFYLYQISYEDRPEKKPDVFSGPPRPQVDPVLRPIFGFTIALFVFGLFWLEANYADFLGQYMGDTTISEWDKSPLVVIYSKTPLNIEAEGVTETDLQTGDGAFHYRYTGLRFFVQSCGRYFLLPPPGQSEPDVRTVILSESSDLRFEVLPASAPRP